MLSALLSKNIFFSFGVMRACLRLNRIIPLGQWYWKSTIGLVVEEDWSAGIMWETEMSPDHLCMYWLVNAVSVRKVCMSSWEAAAREVLSICAWWSVVVEVWRLLSILVIKLSRIHILAFQAYQITPDRWLCFDLGM